MSTSGRTSPGSKGRAPSPSTRRPTQPNFRRRRLVLGVLALAVVVGVGWIVSATFGRSGDGGPEPMAGATETATVTPSPTPTVTTGFVPTACPADALEVVGTIAAASYAPGAPVPVRVTMTNAGPLPCLVDGGSAMLGVVVYSGDDRVWASTDCPAGRAERALLLDVGAVEDLTITWSQVRSAPGCPGNQPSAQPGTYRAGLTINGGATVRPEWEQVFAIG